MSVRISPRDVERALSVGVATALAYLAGVLYLLYGVDRADTLYLSLAALGALPGYWLLAGAATHPGFRYGFRLGLGLRLAAVFAFPLLSDDVYRFVWDGALWWAGLHPLHAPPEVLAANVEGAAFAKTHDALLTAMNSAGYATVYPPGSQLVFAVGGLLSGSLFWSVVAMKGVLLLGELGVYRLLRRLAPGAALLYWLSPLAIVEVVGNAHFEGLAIAGVLLSVYAFRQNRVTLSATGLAAAALVKLVPLVFAPALALAWLWRRARARWTRAAFRSFDYGAGVGFGLMTVLFTAVPLSAFLISGDGKGFGESLDLYFRSFEFNGSLYALASAAGEAYKGWNWIAIIGPGMSVLALAGILVVAFVRQWRQRDVAETMLWCGAIYLACATTVHPWYFVYLLGLAPLTPYRWPYLLAGTAFLSYAAYGQTPIAVPTWALLLEYSPPPAPAPRGAPPPPPPPPPQNRGF